MKSPCYIIEIYICGWENAGWTENDEPRRFDTEAEANDAIDQFIKDTEQAHKEGNLASEYDRNDYRVAHE